MPMLRFIEAYRKHTPEDAKAILNERINLLLTSNKKHLIFGYCLAVVLAIEFLNVMPISDILKWLLPLTAVYITRYYLVFSYTKHQAESSNHNANDLKRNRSAFYSPKIWLYFYRLSTLTGGLSLGHGWLVVIYAKLYCLSKSTFLCIKWCHSSCITFNGVRYNFWYAFYDRNVVSLNDQTLHYPSTSFIFCCTDADSIFNLCSILYSPFCKKSSSKTFISSTAQINAKH